MKYIVNAPNGTVTIGVRFGNATFTHGQLVHDIEEARFFPEFFIPIPEPKITDSDPTVEEMTQPEFVEHIEEILSEIPDVKVEAPKVVEKKVPAKRGRPKKIPFTKG